MLEVTRQRIAGTDLTCDQGGVTSGAVRLPDGAKLGYVWSYGIANRRRAWGGTPTEWHGPRARREAGFRTRKDAAEWLLYLHNHPHH